MRCSYSLFIITAVNQSHLFVKDIINIYLLLLVHTQQNEKRIEAKFIQERERITQFIFTQGDK